jgi:hypothetical protein
MPAPQSRDLLADDRRAVSACWAARPSRDLGCVVADGGMHTSALGRRSNVARRHTLPGVREGAWTEEKVRRELEAFLPDWDTWPSYLDFRRSGRRGLWQAIPRFGATCASPRSTDYCWSVAGSALPRLRSERDFVQRPAARMCLHGRRADGWSPGPTAS